MRTIQYQPIVGPLTTDQPVETRMSWQRQQPEPVRRKWVAALAFTACVMPPTMAQGSANAPTDWRPSHPDRVYARQPMAAARQQALAWSGHTPASGTVPALVSPVYPDSVARRASRAAHLSVQPEFGFVVDVPVQSWLGEQPAQVFRRKLLVERTAIVGPLFVADVTTPAPLLSWLGTYPSRLARARVADRSVIVAPLVVTAAPTLPDLAWLAQATDPLRARRATAASVAVSPIYVPDVTAVVPPLSWLGAQPERIDARAALRTALRQAFAFDRFDAPGVIPLPDLSWQPEIVDLLARRRWSPAMPQVVGPVAPVLVAVAIGWEPTYPDRVSLARVVVGRWQAFAFDRWTAPTPVVVPDLSWFAGGPWVHGARPWHPAHGFDLVAPLLPIVIEVVIETPAHRTRVLYRDWRQADVYEGDMGHEIPTFDKDPGALVDFSINYLPTTRPQVGPYLQDGETITSSLWSVESGPDATLVVSLAKPSDLVGGRARVWLDDGTVDCYYIVRNDIVTSTGREDARRIRIHVLRR